MVSILSDDSSSVIVYSVLSSALKVSELSGLNALASDLRGVCLRCIETGVAAQGHDCAALRCNQSIFQAML